MASKVIIKWLKLIFLASTVSFLFIQIQLRRGVNRNGNGVAASNWKENESNNGLQAPPLPEARASSGSVSVGSSLPSPSAASATVGMPALEEIRKSIEDNNLHSEVFNEDRFGPVETVDYVIVVQVHNRSKYLEKLIESFSTASGIERTLVIFSHDYYSATLNNLVRGMHFCRTMQIFYPYSMQIFPDKFPGQDPKDCPANIGKQKAEEMGCQNWKTPDKYGHYRVANYSQVKHHWWWKMNYVFDGISRLRNFTGWVLLLEEDHYVSPDFLHTFDYIIKNKESLCSECRVISLGFYLKNYNSYASTMNKLAVYPWFSSRHNMGMAINRATWEATRACSNLFCTYDDYNWDWSLMQVNLKCLKPAMTVIYAKSPRVFHIGDCGIHHTGKQCTADTSVTKVTQILNSVKDALFPSKFEVSERSKRTLKAPKENGGWGDVRDHELCLNHSLIHLQQNQPTSQWQMKIDR